MSSKPGVQRHTHKYYRFEMTGKWHCGLPGCSHYQPHIQPVGFNSICWICDKEFTLTDTDLNHSHPTCSVPCRFVRATEEHMEHMRRIHGPSWTPEIT